MHRLSLCLMRLVLRVYPGTASWPPMPVPASGDGLPFLFWSKKTNGASAGLLSSPGTCDGSPPTYATLLPLLIAHSSYHDANEYGSVPSSRGLLAMPPLTGMLCLRSAG